MLSILLVYNVYNARCHPLCCCNAGNFRTVGLKKDYLILSLVLKSVIVNMPELAQSASVVLRQMSQKQTIDRNKWIKRLTQQTLPESHKG